MQRWLHLSTPCSLLRTSKLNLLCRYVLFPAACCSHCPNQCVSLVALLALCLFYGLFVILKCTNRTMKRVFLCSVVFVFLYDF